MTKPMSHQTDPSLDLSFERIVDAPRELIWKAWTTPHLVTKWLTPSPWKTIDCEIDLRPGGTFRTVMLSPEGEKIRNLGCFLEIVDNEKLVWTNAMKQGYRPVTIDPSSGGFAFTAVISLEQHGAGTKYTALVIHGTPEDCKKHEAMGFHQGWGTALDQLLDLVRPL